MLTSKKRIGYAAKVLKSLVGRVWLSVVTVVKDGAGARTLIHGSMGLRCMVAHRRVYGKCSVVW